MARIELAPEVAEDIDRVIGHLEQHDVADIPARIREIIDAVAVLERNPLIGRPAAGRMRELIIGHDSRGYVALYRYIGELDTVFILALRSQREAGYVRGD
jgi:plasmid stabilization system protein ParE